MRSMCRCLVIAVIAVIALYVSPSGWAAGASWIAAGDLHIGRIYHTATRLLDGRVLVAGGRVNCCSSPLLSAEVFDPATNTWTDVASMPLAILGASVLLHDGRVMIMGVVDNGRALAVVLYDPSTNAWATAPGPGMRVGSTMTVLSSGKVLVAGGLVGGAVDALDTAVLFDPATSTWSETGRLNDKRAGATATLLRNGRVLVFAGEVPTSEIEFPEPVTTAELYDPATGRWTRTTSPNRVYAAPSAALLSDGRVLVLGDVGDTELYDPVTARWAISGTRDGERGGYAFAPLQTDQVLVAGGSDIRLAQRYLDGVELYNSTDGTWSHTASLLTPRFLHTATVLLDGRVMVTGGVGGNAGHEATLRSTEVYQGSVAIGPAFTGGWFDPAQNGHGLFIEVLPGQRLLAAWFTFDPMGNPAWFLGVGNYSGNTATINEVDQPSGGRWIPDFDASRIVHHAWGTLTLTFSDCNHGVVAFSSIAGYGNGSMNLTRLTSPAGLGCP